MSFKKLYRRIVLFSLMDCMTIGISWVISFYMYRIFGGFKDVSAHINSPFFRNKIVVSIIVYIVLLGISRFLDTRSKSIRKISLTSISIFIYIIIFILNNIFRANNHILFFVSVIFVILTVSISVLFSIFRKKINKIIDKYLMLNEANVFLIIFCSLLILSGFLKVVQKHRLADIMGIVTYLVLFAGIVEEIINISRENKINVN